MPSASEDCLFVYGTLRSESGHPMNEVLQALGGRVGPGKVRGALYDLGQYPGAVASREAGAFVHGEIYLLSHPGRDLETLDRYEGVDEKRPESGEFRRTRIDVDLDDGRMVAAWIYLYNRPTAGLTPIRSGDYLASRKE